MSPGRLLPAAGASLVTLVWAALVTPGSAHRDAPPASFSVVSAHWHLAHGAVPADELLDNVTARDECECLARCFRRVDCLSFSWVDGHCILYSVRGNVGSLRPGPVRFRTGLAYLGDWCLDDWECRVMASEAVCLYNTCHCPFGQHRHNRTTCGYDPFGTENGGDFTIAPWSSPNEQAADVTTTQEIATAASTTRQATAATARSSTQQTTTTATSATPTTFTAQQTASDPSTNQLAAGAESPNQETAVGSSASQETTAAPSTNQLPAVDTSTSGGTGDGTTTEQALFTETLYSNGGMMGDPVSGQNTDDISTNQLTTAEPTSTSEPLMGEPFTDQLATAGMSTDQKTTLVAPMAAEETAPAQGIAAGTSDSTQSATEGTSDSTQSATEGTSDSTQSATEGTSDSTQSATEGTSDSTQSATEGVMMTGDIQPVTSESRHTATGSQTAVTSTTDRPAAAEVVYVQRNVSVFGAALLNCSGDESRPMALVGMKDDPATAAQTPWQTLDQANCAQFVGHPDLVIGAGTPLIPFEQGKPEYHCGPGQLLVAVSTSIGQYLPRPGILCAPVEEPHTIGPVGCETVTITEPEKYQSPVSDTASWPFQCPQLPQPLGITAVSIDTLQKHWTSITCCLIV
ncbi:mucin-6-like [Amphibalanus amphitrite]|uniref:mucin-6-like n=1 Tax=Amphibalanus amphitrite TaxID=1232801 RepID=UPI001C8FDF7B|nr:mucin-6-like [Amphibalanus amphitrite]